MNKLALIGKGISHSMSPTLYRELISKNIQYDLLDYQNTSDIPSIGKLFEIYEGINITAPYKEHFLGDVILSDGALKLQAINCLAKKGETFFGENTDYLAILDILKRYITKHPALEIIILGDGVMSRVVQIALTELKQQYVVYSRKLTPDFSELDLRQKSHKEKFSLIINTCSRDYVCQSELPLTGEFWDLNYNFRPHLERFANEKIIYTDGIEMLKLQAQHALAFWSGI